MSRDQRAAGPLLGRATKTIGSLIGAATEGYAHHKAKKEQASKQQTSSSSSAALTGYDDDDERDEQTDSEDWALDDASVELSSGVQHRDHAGPIDSSALAMPAAATKPLPYPVILPQRRPQTKSRGFVWAYAPLLGECKGIDEVMFLRFLNEFNEKTQSSQVLEAINLGASVVGAVPSVIAMAISTAMSVCSKGAMEVQSRYKTNTYLDDINKRLFNPRNIHCLILTFRPESSQKIVEVDMDTTNEALMKNMKSADSAMRNMKSVSSGTTTTEVALPEAAPLVYPTLDKMAFAVSEDGQPLPVQKQNALKRSSAFIKNYLDRRAQAEYAGTHGEDSKLSIPAATEEQKFASRYADPNHPANSGGIIALLTGGAVDPRAKLLTKKAELQAKITKQPLSQQDYENIAMGRGGPKARPSILGAVRKVLKEDVLYLLIAEIPNAQEIAELAILES